MGRKMEIVLVDALFIMTFLKNIIPEPWGTDS